MTLLHVRVQGHGVDYLQSLASDSSSGDATRTASLHDMIARLICKNNVWRRKVLDVFTTEDPSFNEAKYAAGGPDSFGMLHSDVVTLFQNHAEECGSGKVQHPLFQEAVKSVDKKRNKIRKSK